MLAESRNLESLSWNLFTFFARLRPLVPFSWPLLQKA